jgi:hypothetical protein
LCPSPVVFSALLRVPELSKAELAELNSKTRPELEKLCRATDIFWRYHCHHDLDKNGIIKLLRADQARLPSAHASPGLECARVPPATLW